MEVNRFEFVRILGKRLFPFRTQKLSQLDRWQFLAVIFRNYFVVFD